MPAKSFLSEMKYEVRHFYATVMRGEVSDANVQGYLRAASQIEELWQQIDEQLAMLLIQGAKPWDAYAQFGYPLAFLRAARTYQVFVRELLAADAASDPGTAGYLPSLRDLRSSQCPVSSHPALFATGYYFSPRYNLCARCRSSTFIGTTH